MLIQLVVQIILNHQLVQWKQDILEMVMLK